VLLAAVLLVATAGAKPVIVGGTVASTAEAPWAIALNNTQSAASGGRYCGAALVAPNKIVTAAHCMDEAVSTYYAVQGRADLADDSVVQHPEWQAALRTEWARKIDQLTAGREWFLRLYRSYTPGA